MKWRIRSEIINGRRFWISAHPFCQSGKGRHTLTWQEAVDHMIEDEVAWRSYTFPVRWMAGLPT